MSIKKIFEKQPQSFQFSKENLVLAEKEINIQKIEKLVLY